MKEAMAHSKPSQNATRHNKLVQTRNQNSCKLVTYKREAMANPKPSHNATGQNDDPVTCDVFKAGNSG